MSEVPLYGGLYDMVTTSSCRSAKWPQRKVAAPRWQCYARTQKEAARTLHAHRGWTQRPLLHPLDQKAGRHVFPHGVFRVLFTETKRPHMTSHPLGLGRCEDRVLDGPASGEKGSKGGSYKIVILARE